MNNTQWAKCSSLPETYIPPTLDGPTTLSNSRPFGSRERVPGRTAERGSTLHLIVLRSTLVPKTLACRTRGMRL